MGAMEKKYFIELSNPPHGGGEWGYGKALWSPTTNSRGSDIYGVMRDVSPGDIIIHSFCEKGDRHRLYDISNAELVYKRSDIKKEFLIYHYENIYKNR